MQLNAANETARVSTDSMTDGADFLNISENCAMSCAACVQASIVQLTAASCSPRSTEVDQRGQSS